MRGSSSAVMVPVAVACGSTVRTRAAPGFSNEARWSKEKRTRGLLDDVGARVVAVLRESDLDVGERVRKAGLDDGFERDVRLHLGVHPKLWPYIDDPE